MGQNGVVKKQYAKQGRCKIITSFLVEGRYGSGEEKKNMFVTSLVIATKAFYIETRWSDDGLCPKLNQ